MNFTLQILRIYFNPAKNLQQKFRFNEILFVNCLIPLVPESSPITLVIMVSAKAYFIYRTVLSGFCKMTLFLSDYICRMKRAGLLEGLYVHDIGSKGQGIARDKDRVVMIEGCVPGDVVDVKIIRDRKKHLEARLINIRQASEFRQHAFCEHFGSCGGCKWQNMSYKGQLKFKQKQVEDALVRIGKLNIPPLLPIIAAHKTSFYRNQLEFSFSNKRWLNEQEIKKDKKYDRNAIGFHCPGRFDRIIDIKKCHLQLDPSNSIRLKTKQFAIENQLSFYDTIEHTGLLRNLIIRTSTTGEVMVLFIFNYYDIQAIEKLMEYIRITFPQITSLQYLINDKQNDSFYDCDVITYAGESTITEKLLGLTFKIGCKSFFQTNSLQAELLFKTILDFAELKGTETVYDLYCGIGSISLCAAQRSGKVLGVECVHESVELAKENSIINGIKNVSFICGDVRQLIKQGLIKKYGQADVIIVDPPRAGMHKDTIEKLMKLLPKRLVYVSCNPSTQARDLALIKESYNIIKVQPIDMFPHTHHIENVILLSCKTT